MIIFLTPSQSHEYYFTVDVSSVGRVYVTVDDRDAITQVLWNKPCDAIEGHKAPEKLVRSIASFLSGNEIVIKVAPRNLTPFELDVVKAIAKIPQGHTVSYGQLAQISGHPSAVRAVASAVGHNPIPIIIPCHRVLPSAGAEVWKSSPAKVLTNSKLAGHYTPHDHIKVQLLANEKTPAESKNVGLDAIPFLDIKT